MHRNSLRAMFAKLGKKLDRVHGQDVKLKYYSRSSNRQRAENAKNKLLSVVARHKKTIDRMKNMTYFGTGMTVGVGATSLVHRFRKDSPTVNKNVSTLKPLKSRR